MRHDWTYWYHWLCHHVAVVNIDGVRFVVKLIVGHG